MQTERQLVGVEEGKAHILNTTTKEKFESDADYVVLALGIRGPKNKVIEEIEGNFENVKILGDSEKAGKVYDAIKTGFDKAYILQ